MRRPMGRNQLWHHVAKHFGLRLPRRPLTTGHSTPLDFVHDAIAHPGRRIAVWANRSGLKTLCASIVAALEHQFGVSPLSSRVLAGSEAQARNLYAYWLRWCERVLRGRLRGRPGRALTRLDNGDFEILTASARRVRGGKVQRIYRDEEDEIPEAVSAASVGMLASRPPVTARSIVTSTWHRAGGPMGRLVAEAARRGFRLHKWNVWETLQRCGPERHEHGRNCRTCPLGPVCLAKARREDPRARVGAAADCEGLLAIDDAIGMLREWSLQQWQAEAECRRPALAGRVYPQFDRSMHVIDGPAWRRGLPTYRAVDWGLRDFVCLWAQVDPAGAVRVTEEYRAQDATTHDNAREIARRDAARPIEATYCDPAGRSRSDQTGYSNVEVFAAAGIPCRYRLDRWARTVQNGVGLIRAALRPAAGRPRLFVAAGCRQLIAAFEAYRLRKVNDAYVDEPVKPQEPWEHPMDALRYLMVNVAAPTGAEARPMGYS